MLTSPTTPSSTTPNSGLTSPHQANGASSQQAQPTTTVIPTRFVDRRVSNGVSQSDPYRFNVNYSEAGQRLAKQAQAQIKTLEKSKEADTVEIVSNTSNTNSRRFSTDQFDANSNGDDWQNVTLLFILL